MTRLFKHRARLRSCKPPPYTTPHPLPPGPWEIRPGKHFFFVDLIRPLPGQQWPTTEADNGLHQAQGFTHPRLSSHFWTSWAGLPLEAKFPFGLLRLVTRQQPLPWAGLYPEPVPRLDPDTPHQDRVQGSSVESPPPSIVLTLGRGSLNIPSAGLKKWPSE